MTARSAMSPVRMYKWMLADEQASEASARSGKKGDLDRTRQTPAARSGAFSLRMSLGRRLLGALGSTIPILALACGPHAGSQTNWLRSCEVDAQCGDGLSCLCGTCTIACSEDAACADRAEAQCVSSEDVGAIALCGGHAASAPGLCLPRCDDGACPDGTACVAGVCSSLPEPTASLSVDLSSQYQTLVGFGASFGYVDDEVLVHPRKGALFEALFAEVGSDILRVRIRHGEPGEVDLMGTREIVDAANASLGRVPTLLMISASPPAELKQNGSTRCGGDPDTCTLVTLPDGGFDYQGFAGYLRSSLEAYANVGIQPEYLGIQNNPNWVPPASESMEACRFLPTEGTEMVTIDGTEVEIAYPGLAQALEVAHGALDGLDMPPRLLAPETSGVSGVVDYTAHLDLSLVGAIAHHMYGTDVSMIDRDALRALGALGTQHERPIFQTEMQAGAFETAVLMHHALTDIGVSAYLQNDFVGSASLAPNPAALVALTEDDFVLQAPYHVLRHYAYYTDPGWIRVAVLQGMENLLASAWLAPDGGAVTVVLMNPSIDEIVVRLEPGLDDPRSTRVVRTVFEGVEHSTDLGALPAEGIVRVPGRAIVTVATQR